MHKSTIAICDDFDAGKENSREHVIWSILKHRFVGIYAPPDYFDFAHYLRGSLSNDIVRGFAVNPTTWILLAGVWLLDALGHFTTVQLFGSDDGDAHRRLASNLASERAPVTHAQLNWGIIYSVLYAHLPRVLFARARCRSVNTNYYC